MDQRGCESGYYGLESRFEVDGRGRGMRSWDSEGAVNEIQQPDVVMAPIRSAGHIPS